MRDGFYTELTWKPNNCERHSIFLSQAGYPVKGLHYFIYALKIIKKFYPDVKVYIGGGGATCQNVGLKQLRDRYFGGYLGYINTFLKDNNLHDCVHSLGMLNEHEMVEHYLKANVFVCPSVIENSPNSVCEAMMLGTPIVASYVGGTPDLIENEKEGLLYQSSAAYMLADNIMRIFADDDLALFLSKNAMNKSHITHDKIKNAESLLNVYKKIIQEKEE